MADLPPCGLQDVEGANAECVEMGNVARADSSTGTGKGGIASGIRCPDDEVWSGCWRSFRVEFCDRGVCATAEGGSVPDERKELTGDMAPLTIASK